MTVTIDNNMKIILDEKHLDKLKLSPGDTLQITYTKDSITLSKPTLGEKYEDQLIKMSKDEDLDVEKLLEMSEYYL